MIGAIAALPAARCAARRGSARRSIGGSTVPSPRSASRARGRVGRVGELDVHGRLPHARLQRLRRALGDEVAARDDPDAVGELLGLLEVLRGEEHGRAVVVQRSHLAPQRGAARGIEAGRRLVEEEHVAGGGRAPARGRAAAACRPSSRRPGGRPPRSARRARAAAPRARAPRRARRPCSAPCMRSSSRPVISGSMAASWSATPIARRTASPSRDHVVPGHARAARRSAAAAS